MGTVNQGKCAFQMPVEAPEMRAYLQRYPFALGPDKAMNERCVEAIRHHFTMRPHRDLLPREKVTAAAVRLRPEETGLPPEVLARLYALMDQAGVPTEKRAAMIDDFGWETKMIPASRSVLVIGCGEGVELLFLRAMLPDAAITAVDYTDSMTREFQKVVGVRFFSGDMHGILNGFGERNERFDLVSSNHTLEHLYTPDAMLATLSGLLNEDGALISTLPMDACEGSPFLERVTAMARSRKIHPVDVVYLDAGHPWKTNPEDIQRSLVAAGFGRVELYQRAEHLSRPVAATEEQFHARKQFGLKLHWIFFGIARSVLRRLFREPPVILVRLLLAAERRAWFGANNLKNRYTQEVCVVARKQE